MQRIEAHGSVHILLCERSSTSMLHSCAARASAAARGARLSRCARSGAVAGVGLCLTLFCDIRFMAAGAKLSTAFARRGLVAEHGSAWMLPRLIGR